MPLPSDEVAKTTLVLAAATFLLALFTLVLAVQTRNVPRRTEDLAEELPRNLPRDRGR